MRKLALLIMYGMLTSSLGCATCNKCGDDCYSFYGGSVARHDYRQGRVGSRFENPGDEIVAEGEYIEEEILEGEFSPAEQTETMQGEIMEEIPAEEVEMEDATSSIDSQAEPVEDMPPGAQPISQRTPRRSSGRIRQEDYLP